jgi:hypothetical protein
MLPKRLSRHRNPSSMAFLTPADQSPPPQACWKKNYSRKIGLRLRAGLRSSQAGGAGFGTLHLDSQLRVAVNDPAKRLQRHLTLDFT